MSDNAILQEVRDGATEMLNGSHGIDEQAWAELPGDIAENAVIEFLYFCQVEGIGDPLPMLQALGVEPVVGL